MRLIDADALRKTAIWAKIRGGMIYETDAKVVLVGLVDTAPTIDAVLVTRCQNCGHYKPRDLFGNAVMECEEWEVRTDPDGHCYKGVPKCED